MDSPLRAPQDASSTLGFFLILIAVCTGVFVVFLPVLGTGHSQIPGYRTYATLRNLKAADEIFRLEYRDMYDLPWRPEYRTNWMEELTAGKGAVLNTRKIRFLNSRLIDGQPVDQWDHPIRAISSTNEQGYVKLDFYSVGADGISSSQGNDPDDVNSWNDARPWTQYYGAERRRAQDIRIISGLMLWCFVLFSGIYFRFVASSRPVRDE